MSDEMMVFALIGVSALTIGLGVFLLKSTAAAKRRKDADRG